MKYFHYTITDFEVASFKGIVGEIPVGFIEYRSTLIGAQIHYKLMDGKLTDVISEGIHEETARRRTEEFLSGFNVSLV